MDRLVIIYILGTPTLKYLIDNSVIYANLLSYT